MNLAELDRAEMESAFAERGIARFHGRQVFRWIHARGVTDFAQMTDLSQELRAKLAETLAVATPALETRQTSEDGTTKFLLKLGDGRHIEAVYIPDTPAQTFCISTQVGCAMGCAFCLTGKMGLVRNLSAGEIAGQVRVLAHATGLAGTPFNIVLMGMGEPLHNYDATMKALKMIADEQGLAVHPRRVTLSTVGLVPGIERLADRAADAEPRDLASRDDRGAARQDRADQSRSTRCTISSTPAGASRSRSAAASRSSTCCSTASTTRPRTRAGSRRSLAGIKAKVNLLPLNEAPGIAFTRPSDDRVNAFAKILADRDIIVSVRKSRGRDIRAACGQLIVEGEKASAGQRLGRALGIQLAGRVTESWKFTVTVINTSTGIPFSNVGVNCHCRTAPIAESSKSDEGEVIARLRDGPVARDDRFHRHDALGAGGAGCRRIDWPDVVRLFAARGCIRRRARRPECQGTR